MVHPRPLHRIIAGFCTLLAVLGAATALPNAVLCIGEDGHVRIEAPHDDACATANGAAGASPCSPSPQAVRVAGGPCGSCTDIPFLSGVVPYMFPAPEKRVHGTRALVSLDYRAEAALFPRGESPTPFHASLEGRPQNLLPQIQTTVLLI